MYLILKNLDKFLVSSGAFGEVGTRGRSHDLVANGGLGTYLSVLCCGKMSDTAEHGSLAAGDGTFSSPCALLFRYRQM